MSVPTKPTVGILGAGSGLGKALAVESLDRGHEVVAFGRSVDDLPRRPGLTSRAVDLVDGASVSRVDVHLGATPYLFWVAGAFIKKPHIEVTEQELDDYLALMLRGPLVFLRRFLRSHVAPIHLVTIASSSSWKLRDHEALYCAVKAAQGTFTRQLVPELLEQHPGSRATVVQPGGLAVPGFLGAEATDLGAMLDPAEVARVIWDVIEGQTEPCTEVQILRQPGPDGGSIPDVSFGSRAPQLPVAVAVPR